MKARRNTWCLAVAALLGAIGAIGARFDSQQAKAALEIAAELRARQTRMAALARTPPVAATAAGSAEAVLAKLPASAPAGDVAAENASTDAKALSLARIVELTRGDPAVMQAGLEAQRVFQRWRYAEFLRQRGLSAEQSEVFLQNVFRDLAGERDLLAAAAALHLPRDDPAVQRLMARTTDEARAAQRTLLGADGLQALDRYDAETMPRAIATGLAGTATLAGEPMNRDQIVRLTALIAAHTREVPGALARLPEVDWPAIDAAARGLLTPRQHALFTTTEPPGPSGGGTRFMWDLDRTINRAVSDRPGAGR